LFNLELYNSELDTFIKVPTDHYFNSQNVERVKEDKKKGNKYLKTDNPRYEVPNIDMIQNQANKLVDVE